MSELIDKNAIVCALKKASRDACGWSLKASIEHDWMIKRVESGEFDAKEPKPHVDSPLDVLVRISECERRISLLEKKHEPEKKYLCYRPCECPTVRLNQRPSPSNCGNCRYLVEVTPHE